MVPAACQEEAQQHAARPAAGCEHRHFCCRRRRCLGGRAWACARCRRVCPAHRSWQRFRGAGAAGNSHVTAGDRHHRNGIHLCKAGAGARQHSRRRYGADGHPGAGRRDYRARCADPLSPQANPCPGSGPADCIAVDPARGMHIRGRRTGVRHWRRRVAARVRLRVRGLAAAPLRRQQRLGTAGFA